MEKLGENVTTGSSVQLERLSEAETSGFTARFVAEVTQKSRLFKDRVAHSLVAMVNPETKKKIKKPPKKVPLSAREKRRLNIHTIPEDCREYDLFLPSPPVP